MFSSWDCSGYNEYRTFQNKGKSVLASDSSSDSSSATPPSLPPLPPMLARNEQITRLWQTAAVALPVLCTAGISYFFNSQLENMKSSISQQITQTKADLASDDLMRRTLHDAQFRFNDQQSRALDELVDASTLLMQSAIAETGYGARGAIHSKEYRDAKRRFDTLYYSKIPALQAAIVSEESKKNILTAMNAFTAGLSALDYNTSPSQASLVKISRIHGATYNNILSRLKAVPASQTQNTVFGRIVMNELAVLVGESVAAAQKSQKDPSGFLRTPGK